MELIDVTLRESIYYESGLDRAGRLSYLDCLCRTLPTGLLKYAEISFIDTDLPSELNYDPLFIRDAHRICDGALGLVAMLHPGRADLSAFDSEVIRLFDMVRIMVPLGKMQSATPYIEYCRGLGVKVACNLLYAASAPLDKILEAEKQAEELGADYFYCADSSGSFTPGHTASLATALVRHKGGLVPGLHLHDHMRMAMANTLIARECGIELHDVSITGAGKGGGNLKAEEALLLLTPKHEIDAALLGGLYRLITTFDRLVGKQTDEHITAFFDFLTGLYRLDLKELAALKEAAGGDPDHYFTELLRGRA